jgi:hypothetical protein
MSDGLIIYVKNDAQKKELLKNHPDVNPDSFFNMKGGEKGMDDLLPMVCLTKDDKERCETGEEYIDIFSKELK